MKRLLLLPLIVIFGGCLRRPVTECPAPKKIYIPVPVAPPMPPTLPPVALPSWNTPEGALPDEVMAACAANEEILLGRIDALEGILDAYRKAALAPPVVAETPVKPAISSSPVHR